MKALTVAQPFASLIVHGVKQWETRPSPPNGDMRPDGVRGLPGKRIEAGERIAIHAAARWDRSWLGWHDGNSEKCDILNELGVDLMEDEVDGFDQYLCEERWAGLPTGAVVGTVEVVEAVQIFHEDDMVKNIDTVSTQTHVGISEEGGDVRLALWRRIGYPIDEWNETDLTDQLPYGNWVSGNWAWQLAAPVRFDQPAPAKGKQGVWEWEQ